MKNLLLILLFSFGASVSVSAQQPAGRQDKIEALYVAYMTQQLKLTEDEAQKFWPVHSQYDSEIKSTLSIDNELDRQQKTLDIKKRYQDRFIKIIGAARTNEFYKTDAEFRKRMVERLKKIRQGNGNRLH